MAQHGTTPEGYPFWVHQAGPTYFDISMQRNDTVLCKTYEENPPREANINALIQEMARELREIPEEQTRLYAKEVPVVSKHIDVIEDSSARP